MALSTRTSPAMPHGAHVLGARRSAYEVDAGALIAAVAELDCPLCAHAIGEHALGGPCHHCDCNGVLTCAIVEPDDD